MGSGYVGILSVELHFPASGSLKGKRKYVKSAKAQLANRFGAAVAETDHHDLWQRAELTAALVGRDITDLGNRASALERFVISMFPEGAQVGRRLVSREDLL